MSRRALVVDDDRAMVRRLADILRIKGWHVTHAYSGAGAVEAASEGVYDVVLMDIKMPGMNGLSALRAMKAVQPHLRVLLMTANAAHEQFSEAECEGVVDVMPKPINVPLLLGVLTQTLTRQQPVLVVDHNAAFLKTLLDVLQLHGFEAVIAKTIEGARLALARHRPVAVLLHAHVGTASPRDAVAAVRGVNPDVALILYGGAHGAEVEAHRIAPPEWVHAFLRKPFDVDQVTRLLDAIRPAD